MFPEYIHFFHNALTLVGNHWQFQLPKVDGKFLNFNTPVSYTLPLSPPAGFLARMVEHYHQFRYRRPDPFSLLNTPSFSHSMGTEISVKVDIVAPFFHKLCNGFHGRGPRWPRKRLPVSWYLPLRSSSSLYMAVVASWFNVIRRFFLVFFSMISIFMAGRISFICPTVNLRISEALKFVLIPIAKIVTADT